MKVLKHDQFGENRVVLTTDQGKALRLFIQRENSLNYSEIIQGVIRSYNDGLHGYFAETKKGSVFLPTDQAISLGSQANIKISKEPRFEKDATGILTTQPLQDAEDIAHVLSQEYNVPITSISSDEMDEIVFDALQTDILLPSQGAIHIEKTRVAWTIDVDTGKSLQSIDMINHEATQEIARQVILKNMGGLILIDFAGSKRALYRQHLEHLIKKYFKDDIRSRLSGWTYNKLYEIKRSRQDSCLLEKCSNHNVIEVYYRIRRQAEKIKAPNILFQVHPRLIPLLKSSGIRGIFQPKNTESLSDFDIKEIRNES